MAVLQYLAPESLEEVFELLATHGDDARLIAGGTALTILMRQRLVRPSVLVSLARISELRGIERVNGELGIGAMTTHREAELNGLVKQHAPLLSETLRRVATVRIRNAATLGGNLVHADPNQDPPVALVALAASVRLKSRNGTRQIALEDFFLDYYETAIRPGEVVVSIHVPKRDARGGAAFSKFLPRTADDYATVSVAAVVTLDDSGRCAAVRIALGSAGATTIRARAAEAELQGKAPTGQVIEAAGTAVRDEIDPLDDGRGSPAYKRDMAAVWVRRTLSQALERVGHGVSRPERGTDPARARTNTKHV